MSLGGQPYSNHHRSPAIYIRVGLFTSVNPIWKLFHSHWTKFISLMILDPVVLTINITMIPTTPFIACIHSFITHMYMYIVYIHMWASVPCVLRGLVQVCSLFPSRGPWKLFELSGLRAVACIGCAT